MNSESRIPYVLNRPPAKHPLLSRRVPVKLYSQEPDKSTASTAVIDRVDHFRDEWLFRRTNDRSRHFDESTTNVRFA